MMQEITNCSSLIFELIMCFFFITTLLLVRKIMTGDKFHMEEIQQHKTKTLKKHLTKHETRQEAFERLYGKTPLFKDEPKQQVQERKSNSPFANVINWIFKFSIFGTWSLETMKNKEVFMFFSGFFMISYSIVGAINLHEISDFFESFGLSKGVLTLWMGGITLFFVIQFLRGGSYMGGVHLFNSGIKGSAFSAYYASPTAAAPKPQIGGKDYTAEAKAKFNNSSSNKEYAAMNEFKGYMNSKMEWMTNSGREEYMKDIFGGGK